MMSLTESESAERDDTGWKYYKFLVEGVQSCSPGDTLCVPQDTNFVWPAANGLWDGPASIAVEQTGVALGPLPTTLEYTKHDYDMNALPVAAGAASLAPEVIVVPVNVFVAVPDEDLDPIGHAVASNVIEPAFYRALFDDQWEVSGVRGSAPGGKTELYTGGFNLKTSLHHTSTAAHLRRVTWIGRDHVNPDDVFAQCGVQFRLASVTAYIEDNPQAIFFEDAGGEKICPASAGLQPLHTGMIARAQQEPLPLYPYGDYAAQGINVLFSPRVSGCVEVAGVGSDTANYAALPLNPVMVSAPELTLAHELGHVLGLDDSFLAGHIMSGESTFHILRCEYRDGVPLPAPPYGCEPNPADQYEHCRVIRERAAMFANGSGANPSPIAMEPPNASAATWTIDGQALSFDTTQFSEGTASLLVPAGGYRLIESPYFSTTELGELGTTLELQLWLSDPQPNPYWLGSLDAFISAPSAGIYNAYLGHVELTGHATQEWNAVSFELDEATRTWLSGDVTDAQLALAVNTPSDAPSVLLDGLAFGGEVVTVPREPNQTGEASVLRLLSFEDSEDWTASNGTNSSSAWVTDGEASLSVSGTGYVELESRPLNTSYLAEVTNLLSIELAVPDVVTNPYWQGTLQLFVSCPSANIYNAFQGQIDLAQATLGDYNQLVFDLDNSVVSAFAAIGQICSLKFSLNVPEGSGAYHFDHVTFVP